MIDPKSARRGLFLVFLILFLDIMGIAIIVPVLPAYLKELTGDTISEAAVDGGWLLLAYSAVWSFVASYRYDWSEGQIGLSLGIFGICGALVMGFVLPKAIPLLGEWKAGAVGLIFTGLGLAGYALSFQGWMIYAVILATCLEALADPPLRSIASAKVPPSAQGELQGALSSISSFTTILGPLMFAQIFSVFTAAQAPVTFAGAPYVLGAIFVALAIAVYILKVRPAQAPVDDGGAVKQAV